MTQQDQINALIARLDIVKSHVTIIEANSLPPVDLKGLTDEVTSLEGVVAAGIPTVTPVVATTPAA